MDEQENAAAGSVRQEPVTNNPVESKAAPVSELPKDGLDTQPATDPTPQSDKPTTVKKKPPVAIIFAVIFAVLLAIATVYVYAKGKNDDKKAADTAASQSSNSANQQTTDNSAAQDASDAANSALSQDDSKDVPDSDLTDQNLGLQN